jgi:hypothetical protein
MDEVHHYGSKVDNDGYIISIIDQMDEIHQKEKKNDV